MQCDDINIKLILRAETMLNKNHWNIIATSRIQKGRDIISEILKKFNIKDIPYHPNLLIQKDRTKVLLIFSEKSKFPISTKKGIQTVVSGIDWFKYKLCQYIENKTGIQVGIIMYSRQSHELIIRQLNQLPNPLPWFSGEGCLVNFLKSSYKNPNEKKDNKIKKIYSDGYNEHELKEMSEIKKQLIEKQTLQSYNPLPILDCIKCYERFPETAYRCMKGKHKKIKVFAIWNVSEFEQRKLTIQQSLLSN